MHNAAGTNFASSLLEPPPPLPLVSRPGLEYLEYPYIIAHNYSIVHIMDRNGQETRGRLRCFQHAVALQPGYEL